jgi:heme exporter protein D
MLAVWQFYLFVVFKSSSSIANAPGGTLHLWSAVGITLIACISFFVFSVFLRHDWDDELDSTS